MKMIRSKLALFAMVLLPSCMTVPLDSEIPWQSTNIGGVSYTCRYPGAPGILYVRNFTPYQKNIQYYDGSEWQLLPVGPDSTNSSQSANCNRTINFRED